MSLINVLIVDNTNRNAVVVHLLYVVTERKWKTRFIFVVTVDTKQRVVSSYMTKTIGEEVEAAWLLLAAEALLVEAVEEVLVAAVLEVAREAVAELAFGLNVEDALLARY